MGCDRCSSPGIVVICSISLLEAMKASPSVVQKQEASLARAQTQLLDAADSPLALTSPFGKDDCMRSWCGGLPIGLVRSRLPVIAQVSRSLSTSHDEINENEN